MGASRSPRKHWRAPRAAAGPAQPAGSVSPGSGAHSAALGHVLRARGACRGPRAKPAGRGLRACAPRSPRPHPLPGASAARGRERAAPGFAAWRRVVMGPTGAPGRSLDGVRAVSGSTPVRVGGRVGRARRKKLTGLRGARGDAALWKADWVNSSRCNLTVSEMGRAGRLSSEGGSVP